MSYLIFIAILTFFVSSKSNITSYVHSYCTNLMEKDSSSNEKNHQENTLFQYIKAMIIKQNSYAQCLPYGPTISFALISRVTEPIYSYAAFSVFIQTIYAIQNGYFISNDDFPYNDDYSMFPKILPLLAAMTSSSTIFDFYVWIDAGKLS